MAAKTAQPCPEEPVILPKVMVSAAGMRKINSISMKLLNGVGFSKGWPLLALKKRRHWCPIP